MLIMHIDANSAYLSWTAAALLEEGYPIDLRTIPAVIAGNPETRHGIILAKSIPCKKRGIITGESLFAARQKCPDLAVFPPDYDLYMAASDAMFQILCEYSPIVQRYSIDECFLDYTHSRLRFGDPVETAYEIKERIRKELGFTVNVGVSVNKLLAKMASELMKPDQVHTLWPREIEEKMWPLPVRELYMVGRVTEQKLTRININTIGDLAGADPIHMRAMLKSHGLLIWEYANGIDDTPVIPNHEIVQKGLGNSTTLPRDVDDREEAKKILLGLTERVAMRLRNLGCLASLISVSVKTGGFIRYSHQVKLKAPVDATSEIFRHVTELFDQCWKGEPLRHLGVSVSEFSGAGDCQLCLFDLASRAKDQKIDRIVDAIRRKYGDRAIMRGTFANSGTAPLQGGVNDGNYMMMGGRGGDDPGGTD